MLDVTWITARAHEHPLYDAIGADELTLLNPTSTGGQIELVFKQAQVTERIPIPRWIFSDWVEPTESPAKAFVIKRFARNSPENVA
jgi:hypothetical protein